MVSTSLPRAAAVLTNADFYGTLAAARSLGRHGVPVTVAHDTRLGAASWSRFVNQAVRSPPTRSSRAFIEWLLELGAKQPGQVLYPASDDAAYLYASHRAELSKHFRLYSPPLEAIYALLNKRKLYTEGQAAGLELPRTWFPESAKDLARIAREAATPLMIKPVTQVLFHSRRKGQLVSSAEGLEAEYRAFAAEPYERELVEHDPQVVQPMVQEFHPNAAQSIYSLSGFLSQEGDWAMRGAIKVLQLPRKLGVGICFEDQSVEPRLAASLLTLCRRVGYYGVFEAEFICIGDQRLLIDFNPRFFGQLGFDLARQLPLVILAYEAALGHTGEVARLLGEANKWAAPADAPPAFCHKNALQLLLRWQEVAGSMPSDEAGQWRQWLKAHSAVDAVLDADDWKPAAVDSLNRLAGYARHPRAFVRSVVFNR